ncbi:MAG: hypothetical protein KIT31_12645 [Deltaproteobacteria bacterium]|nr:hypothetical protein [Deltaproteobacteria bacterium]
MGVFARRIAYDAPCVPRTRGACLLGLRSDELALRWAAVAATVDSEFAPRKPISEGSRQSKAFHDAAMEAVHFPLAK